MRKLYSLMLVFLLVGCSSDFHAFQKIASIKLNIDEKSEFLNSICISTDKYAVFANPYPSLKNYSKSTLYCLDLTNSRQVWSKEIVRFGKDGFARFNNFIYAVINERLVKIDIETGNQTNVSNDKVDNLVNIDEDSIYCTRDIYDYKNSSFDFHCLSFDPAKGKLNWDTKIAMNFGWVIPGKDCVAIFTSNTVDHKFAVLDKNSGEVLRYEPISSRKRIENIDDNANLIFFHNNALRMNSINGSIKLIDYDKLPDWADIGGIYFKGSLFIVRKNRQLQKLDLKTGKPVFVINLYEKEHIKIDYEKGYLIGIGNNIFRLISANTGIVLSQINLEKPIINWRFIKDGYAIQTDKKKIEIYDNQTLRHQQTIITDKEIKNLTSFDIDMFGVLFTDGQYSMYSSRNFVDSH